LSYYYNVITVTEYLTASQDLYLLIA